MRKGVIFSSIVFFVALLGLLMLSVFSVGDIDSEVFGNE